MNRLSLLRLLPLVTLAGLAGVARAQLADTYDPATGQLTIPSIVIGAADFQNLVVTVSPNLVLGPTMGATYASAIGDFYDTTKSTIYVAAVNVGATTYYDPAAVVTGLISFASVAGADTYSGGLLYLPSVQVLGGVLYQGVTVRVAANQITHVGSGLPTVSQNTYDTATHVLTIPVALYNGRYYTNVTANVALTDVVQVAGGHQGTDTVLYSFNGIADGGNPGATVIQGSDGNFYGTASGGGDVNGDGTIFQLTPAGAYTVLHTFNGSDGSYPFAPLVGDGQGNFYGTTPLGGANGFGTAFRITAGGQLTTLWSFQGGTADGSNPNGLTLAKDGNLYGTTTSGGTTGNGVVFQISLPGGIEKPIYSFAGGSDAAAPFAGLVEAGNGILYGTTVNGGTNNLGAVFSVTTGGTEAVLWSFGTTGTDGYYPQAALIQGSDGNLYGTTVYGGAYNVGTVFSVNPITQQEQLVYSFAGAGGLPGSADGAYPFGGVIQGTDGALYGAANYGGAYNEGTAFRLVIATGKETILYSFNGDDALANSLDGAYSNALIQAADGNLYGTTYQGGSTNGGIVFRLAP